MHRHIALFDLDGVVFDTEPQYTIFWGSQFKKYYPQEPGLEHKVKGMTLVQIYDMSTTSHKSRLTLLANSTSLKLI